jgi:hypothetical protein
MQLWHGLCHCVLCAQQRKRVLWTVHPLTHRERQSHIHTCTSADGSRGDAQRNITGAPSTIPLWVYLGGTVPIGLAAYFFNFFRARKMTIPQKPFLQLMVDDNEGVRNSAMLAVCLSDFLDLADQNLTDAHVKPIAEGIRASKRLKTVTYVTEPPLRHTRALCAWT